MIFVTGGSGFLGSKLVAALRERGEGVAAPSRDELDLRDASAVASYLRDNRVDRVIHLAASLDKSDDASQWRDTFEVGKSVIYAAADAGVELLVTTGTMDEVGTVEGIVTADAPTAPASTYGLCKSLLLETARFLASRSKLQVEWVRPTAIYGPGQTGSMLVPDAFTKAKNGESGQFTSGEQLRDFIYVDDVIDWLVRAAAIEPNSPGVKVHHVGTGKPVRVRDVLSKIAELSNAEFELGVIPRRPGEPDLFGVPQFHDDREPLSGWNVRVDIDDGLMRTWQWWQNQ